MRANGKGVNVPSLLMQLGHPGWCLPFHLQNLFWREDKVVNRFEARVAKLAPVPDALAQFVEVSFE